MKRPDLRTADVMLDYQLRNPSLGKPDALTEIDLYIFLDVLSQFDGVEDSRVWDVYYNNLNR